MTLRHTLVLLASALPFAALPQNTVGLLTNEAAFSQEGYTLFYPAAQNTAFLVDNCGRLVHEWTDTLSTPGNAIYLMDNGDIVRCAKSYGLSPIPFDRGGAGEFVDRRDWNGQLLWRYTYNTPLHRMHHDVAMLPNGNVLIIAWEYKTLAEAVAVGRDTTGYGDDSVWPDHIIEVEPLGVDSGNIVWEWHAWDHLIQDFDPNLPNYGVVADHPERIDINFDPQVSADWHHMNAIDYNEELDQILVSVPNFNEVWVIDHSTTTAEAAGSTGGNSGMGGDLLYRWGAPEAYGRGTAADQRLFFQHDARWLGPGLPLNDPDKGKILVFNNRLGGNYSSVDMFVPPVDGQGNYPLAPGDTFGPDSAAWRYTAPTPTDMFSAGLSGAHKTPNGNFVICVGRNGWILEVDAMGSLHWEYKIPMAQGVPVAQGTNLQPGQSVFRATKYSSDHPFLSGQALPPLGYIELQPDTTFCGSFNVAVRPLEAEEGSLVYPNPTTGPFSLAGRPGEAVEVLDLSGKVVARHNALGGAEWIDLSHLADGAYVVRIGEHSRTILLKQGGR